MSGASLVDARQAIQAARDNLDVLWEWARSPSKLSDNAETVDTYVFQIVSELTAARLTIEGLIDEQLQDDPQKMDLNEWGGTNVKNDR